MTGDRRKMKGEEKTETGGEKRGGVVGGGGGGGVEDEAQSCHFTTGEMNDFLPLDTEP